MLTPVRFIRVHHDLLEVFTHPSPADAYGVNDVREDATDSRERLFRRIYHGYMAGTLGLPYLPDVAPAGPPGRPATGL